jgi:hypothetical protein
MERRRQRKKKEGQNEVEELIEQKDKFKGKGRRKKLYREGRGGRVANEIGRKGRKKS